MKIVLTGPECIGKTTLALDIAKHYGTHIVSEYARTFLTNKPNGTYEQADLLTIAKGQHTKEKMVARRPKIICDTSLLVLYMWSKIKYNSVHQEIADLLSANEVDLYILPFWDVPYKSDPLRENPENREEFYHLYLNELKKRHLPYLTVKGSSDQRLEIARQTIDTLKKYKN